MEKNSDMVKEIIKLRTGEEPQIDEPTCVIWKADHENCKGCTSDLACGRLATILLVSFKAAMYEPKNFDDHIRALEYQSNMVDRILDAKTVEEVHSIV